MLTLTTTDQLAAFCERAAKAPYVTVDTEFLRERTYYSKLCLVQLAIPGDAEEDAVLVDPLAKSMQLDPLYDLFRNNKVVKVFHAARQDLEIFYVEGQVIPTPLFDTQVAAMVAGFGSCPSFVYRPLINRYRCRKRIAPTAHGCENARRIDRPLPNTRRSRRTRWGDPHRCRCPSHTCRSLGPRS